MRLPFAATPLICLALAACGNPDTPAGRAADARHDHFESIGDAMKEINEQLKASTPELAKIQTAAAAINDLAPKLETWFPAGSGPDGEGIKTDALQAVWTKPDEFKQEAAKFAAESAKFDVLAKAGNVATLGDGVKGLGASCKSCHDKFRED